MAQYDDSQNYDTPYGTPGTSAPSGDPNGPGSPVWNAVVAIYQKELGRPPENDQVVQQWIQGTGGNLTQIWQAIKNTPEAATYAKSQQKPDPTNPNPTTPTPPPTGTTTTAPSGLSFADVLAKTNAYASGQGGWGRNLTDAEIAQAKQDLGFQDGALIDPSKLTTIQQWVDAHKPSGTTTVTPPPPPPTTTTGTGTGTGTTTTTGTAPGPTPNVPGYTPPPAFNGPPAFTYDAFRAPTAEDVLNDPGYQFTLQQGSQAMQQSAAARGVLNTGGTLKDLIGYGQNLASTKYNDIFSRDLTKYQTNRQNALDAYNTNYGTQYKDPYSINYASQYTDPFQYNNQTAMELYGAAANNFGLQQNNNQFNANLGLNYAQLGQNQKQFDATQGFNYAQLGQNQNQFNASLNQNQNQFNSNLDFQKWLQNYKMTVLDPFDMKYRLATAL